MGFYYYGESVGVNHFLGKTFVTVEVDKDKNIIVFEEDILDIYMMLHEDDCCEDVYIADICGDIKDLVGSPILSAECSSDSKKRDGREDESESFTWTFYKIATIKGSVTIRWFGDSNGYYSEEVSILKNPINKER